MLYADERYDYDDDNDDRADDVDSCATEDIMLCIILKDLLVLAAAVSDLATVI